MFQNYYVELIHSQIWRYRGDPLKHMPDWAPFLGLGFDVWDCERLVQMGWLHGSPQSIAKISTLMQHWLGPFRGPNPERSTVKIFGS